MQLKLFASFNKKPDFFVKVFSLIIVMLATLWGIPIHVEKAQILEDHLQLRKYDRNCGVFTPVNIR